MEGVELNAKCWGLILAHMTGFASINAWGTVQQTAFFSQNWIISWLVVPAALITNIPLLKFTAWMRKSIAGGNEDELEKMWDEEEEEAQTFGHVPTDYICLYLFGTLCIPVFCKFIVMLHELEEAEEKEKERKALNQKKH